MVGIYFDPAKTLRELSGHAIRGKVAFEEEAPRFDDRKRHVIVHGWYDIPEPMYRLGTFRLQDTPDDEGWQEKLTLRFFEEFQLKNGVYVPRNSKVTLIGTVKDRKPSELLRIDRIGFRTANLEDALPTAWFVQDGVRY